MKKTYITPSMQSYKIEPTTMLALSGDVDTLKRTYANGDEAMSGGFRGGILEDDETE